MFPAGPERIRRVVFVLAFAGCPQVAHAQEKTVQSIIGEAVQITDAIAKRCHAAAGADEKAYNDCWNAQSAAFASLANFDADSFEAFSLEQCTADVPEWKDVDWVEAGDCVYK